MAVQYAFAKIVTDGLALAVDAADPTSYPGTGTTWRDVSTSNNSGTITGSVAYSTAYKGGLVFSGPTASITFSTASANFGTGSFTVEMAFSPSSFNGRHWLFSKNSGSFPSFGAYLSGSGGTATLWSEYRVSSTISCSISASTVFTTGSVYQVDFRYAPGISASGFVVNGVPIGGGLGNNAGSLTNTGSFFLGNTAVSSSQAFSGSIYAVKLYSANSIESANRNFNAIASRFNLPLITDTARKQFDILVVAGGGGGGSGGFPYGGGGGGAGGLQYINTTTLNSGISTAIIGAGGSGGGSLTNGGNSSFSSLVSIGGGRASTTTVSSSTGGSGGGGSFNTSFTSGSSGIPGQGNSGASASSISGGGGGAGSAAISGVGGSGSFISAFTAIGGSPSGWFAGGGAGDSAVGGIGGGGTGGTFGNPGQTGSSNTGGGGGGGGGSNSGGAGGSGIVAIRYSGGPIALGGEITQSAGFTYHVFRTVGSSSFTLF